MAEVTSAVQPQGREDAELGSYKPLSGLALGSIILGVLSVLALAPWQGFWMLPAGAVVLGVAALHSLRRRGDEVSGVRQARIGITLGLVLGVGGLGTFYLPRYLLKESAKVVGMQWMKALAENRLERAVFLGWPPMERPPEDSHWEVVKRIDRNLEDAYNELKRMALPKRMAELGQRAHISFHSVEDYSEDRQKAMVNLVYQVTVPGKGAFLVLLQMQSAPDPRSGRLDWIVQHHFAPYKARTAKIFRRPQGHSHFDEDGHGH